MTYFSFSWGFRHSNYVNFFMQLSQLRVSKVTSSGPTSKLSKMLVPCSFAIF